MSKTVCVKSFSCACGRDHGTPGFRAEEIRPAVSVAKRGDIPGDIAASISTQDWDNAGGNERPEKSKPIRLEF